MSAKHPPAGVRPEDRFDLLDYFDEPPVRTFSESVDAELQERRAVGPSNEEKPIGEKLPGKDDKDDKDIKDGIDEKMQRDKPELDKPSLDTKIQTDRKNVEDGAGAGSGRATVRAVHDEVVM